MLAVWIRRTKRIPCLDGYQCAMSKWYTCVYNYLVAIRIVPMQTLWNWSDLHGLLRFCSPSLWLMHLLAHYHDYIPPVWYYYTRQLWMTIYDTGAWEAEIEWSGHRSLPVLLWKIGSTLKILLYSHISEPWQQSRLECRYLPPVEESGVRSYRV
jgi:hypothetical protein